MSLPEPSLQFDFKSTYQITDSAGKQVTKVKNQAPTPAGQNYDATLEHTCSIVSDSVMGNCMSFDGESGYIHFPALTSPGNGDFSKGFSITTWVKAKELVSGMALLDFGKSIHDNLKLNFTDSNGGFELAYHPGIEKEAIAVSTPNPNPLKVNALGKGEWAHIAVTVSAAGTGRLYLNGIRLAKSTPANKGLLPNPNITTHYNYIGTSFWSSSEAPYFNGKMAWLSLYNTRLSETEIFDDLCQALTSHIKLSPSLQYNFKAIQPPAQGADGIGTIADLSGNKYNGTVEKGCTLVSDPMMGNCMEFDGQSGYVKLPALPATGVTDLAKGLTITTWVNIDSLKDGQSLIEFGPSTGYQNIALALSRETDGNGRLSYLITGEDSSDVTAFFMEGEQKNPISTEAWFHLAFTLDAIGKGKFYVNGFEVKNTTGLKSITLPDADIVTFSNLLGGPQPGNILGNRPFNGKMAWFSMYNSAHSWEQVLVDMYQAIRPPEPLNPTLEFDFSSLVPSAKSIVGKIVDGSGNGFDGIVQPGCSLVNDPVMGNCLEFDGSGFVKLPPMPGNGATNLSSGFSFTCWVKVNPENITKDGSDLLCFKKDGVNHLVFGILQGTKGYDCGFLNMIQNKLEKLGPVEIGSSSDWFHLAVSINGSGEGKFYLNGIEVYKNQTPNSKLLPVKDIVFSYNTIGGSLNIDNDGGSECLQGRMAWFCLYNKALQEPEINADMIKGESNRKVSFRKSIPLGFKLYSENNYDQVPTLFIEQQGKGKDLYLEISNEGMPEMNIPVVANGTASDTHYHFQLRFRPGTLSTNFLKSQPSITGWSLAVGSQSGSGTEYISLLCTKRIDSIAKGNSHTLCIPSVNADPTGGARNTHVEFNYKLTSNLSGTRLQSLSVISHLGQKDIPLHVDVVGSPQVLNDGSTHNNLLFRIENTGADSVNLNHANTNTQSASSPAPSRFELEVLAQPTGAFMEWALVAQDEVSSMALEWPVIGVVASVTGTASPYTLNLREPLSAALNGSVQLNIVPPTGAIQTCTLHANAASSAPSIEVSSTSSIPTGSIITMTNYLGTLNSNSYESDTLSLASDLTSGITANTNLIVSPAPKIYAKVLTWDADNDTITFSEKLSLWEGSIVSTHNPVGIAKGTYHSTTIELVQKYSGTIPVGTELTIVSPGGEKFAAEVAKDSNQSAQLEVKFPITVVAGSSISYSNELGTVVKAKHKHGQTIANITVYTAPAGSPIAPAPGMSLVITSPLASPIEVECISALDTTITLKHDLSVDVPAGSIVSLAAAQADWKLVQNNQTPDLITGTVSWSITSETVTEIKPGESLEFLLSGIKSEIPAGTSTITLKYYNIPGYWDSKLTTPIQKGPVIYDGQKVGIGTNKPANTLDVNGDFSVSGNGGIGTDNPNYPLEIKSGTHPQLNILNGSDNFEIGTTSEGKGTLFSKNGFSFGYLGKAPSSITPTTTLTKPSLLTLTADGKLGIGTGFNDPFSSLHIVDPGGPAQKHDMKHGLIVSDSLGGGAINIGVSSGNVSSSEKNKKLNTLPSGTSYVQSAYVNNAQCDDLSCALPLALNPYGGEVSIGNYIKEGKGSANLKVNGEISGGQITGDNLHGTSLTILGAGYSYIQSTITHDYLPSNNQGLAIGKNYTQSLKEIDFINTSIEYSTKKEIDDDKLNSDSYDDDHDAFHFYQMTSKSSADLLMSISKSGYVGIGGDKPDYPLVVNGGTYLTFGNPGYTWAGSSTIYSDKELPAGSGVSIYVDHTIISGSFYSFSDKRVKKNLKLTNGKKDLAQLLLLKITNYKEKDNFGLDLGKKKGLIAQEVEQILPRSVRTVIGHTPDIYALAKKINRDKKKQELTVHLEKKHGLKKGDIVKLITDSNQHLEKEVMDVPDPKKLVLKGWTEQTKKLFVYGKKVDDLRAIDYHQVAMLNVSATQEIHKQLVASKKDNKQLKKHCQKLEKECRQLRKESEQLQQQHKADMAALRDELSTIKELIANL